MECAVIGIPDKVMGELVGAVVILKPGTNATMDELINHCKAQIAPFSVPVFVDVQRAVPVPGNVDAYEGLPKNATGKPEKKKMRGELEAKYLKYLASKGSKA